MGTHSKISRIPEFSLPGIREREHLQGGESLTFIGRGDCSVGCRAGRCRRGSWNRHGNRFSGNSTRLRRRQSWSHGSAALPWRPRPVCFRG